MADDTLKAGFTGNPRDKSAGIKEKVIQSASALRHEGDSIVAGVSDHPHTATTLLIGLTAAAFSIGYLMGRSSADSGFSAYWRR